MRVPGIERVGIVGAGLMGHGIALCFAAAGYDVTLTDTSEGRLAEALGHVRASLAVLAEQGRVEPAVADAAPCRIRTSTDLPRAMGDTDFVVEAVYEDLALKRELFAALDAACPPHAIFASNTSSFMTSQLAPATRRPDRVLVANWWNPAHLLPLVEVVRGPQTSEATLLTTTRVLESVGKRPVVLQKESIGFVGNRLQFALLREALAIVERGIASAADVDTVVKTSFGRRLAVAGPLEVFDIAGWDTIAHICQEVFPDLDTRTTTPPSVEHLVARGDLGVKTGQGFYAWDADAVVALRRRLTNALGTIDTL
jgi:3-hydroxybutyryl-CoA dehydrogenase